MQKGDERIIGCRALVEYAADRLARVWGEMDRTGERDSEGDWEATLEMNSRTSLWDWRVMRSDSVDVMHPLEY